jgi:hypothetical protein
MGRNRNIQRIGGLESGIALHHAAPPDTRPARGTSFPQMSRTGNSAALRSLPAGIGGRVYHKSSRSKSKNGNSIAPGRSFPCVTPIQKAPQCRVQSAPTFFINGNQYSGPLEYNELVDVLNLAAGL